jgi:hypothetical protein
MATLVDVPCAPLINLVATEQQLWDEERACLLLLLEARVLMNAMLEQLEYRGDWRGTGCRRAPGSTLPLLEIADQLRRDPPSELDLALELGALKRQVISEIKRNHALNANIARLDVKISLLIHNRGTTHDLATKRREIWITRWAARKCVGYRRNCFFLKKNYFYK